MAFQVVNRAGPGIDAQLIPDMIAALAVKLSRRMLRSVRTRPGGRSPLTKLSLFLVAGYLVGLTDPEFDEEGAPSDADMRRLW